LLPPHWSIRTGAYCCSSAQRDGRWLACGNFPAEKSRKTKPPEAALARELREELGIETEVEAMAPAAFASAGLGDRHLLLLLYLCRSWLGIPQALDASEIRWVRPVDMPALPMPPADQPLVSALRAML
jgi:8-oxo-dGTP diphosphatase